MGDTPMPPAGAAPCTRFQTDEDEKWTGHLPTDRQALLHSWEGRELWGRPNSPGRGPAPCIPAENKGKRRTAQSARGHLASSSGSLLLGEG